jgi:hypothetical protein
VPARLVAIAALAGSFWLLTGWARADIAGPEFSRYLYLGAVAPVLAGCELARAAVVPLRTFAVLGAVVALCAVLGLNTARRGV